MAQIPDHQLERLALPLIEAVAEYFKDPEVKKQFEAWERERKGGNKEMPIQWYGSPYSELETNAKAKPLYVSVTKNTFLFNSYARDEFGIQKQVVIGVDEDERKIFLMPAKQGK